MTRRQLLYLFFNALQNLRPLGQILGAAGGSASELQNLSVSALLTRIATQGTDSQKQALQQLLQGLRK